MTIDKIIRGLVERQDALAQSVEMLRDTVHETSNTVNALGGMMEKLLGVMRTLAEIVVAHERRIAQIEDRR